MVEMPVWMNSSGFRRETGLMGGPTDRQTLVRHDSGEPVDRLSTPVKASSDHLPGDAEPGDTFNQAHRGRGEVDPGGLLEHLEHGDPVRDIDNLARRAHGPFHL